MIPTVDPWLWVLMALILQPLIAMLWAYLLIKGIIAYTRKSIGNAIDDRVNHVMEKIDK